MIALEKQRNALEALNRVLGGARMMGYENCAGAEIAASLDTAEYLVVLLLKAEDCTTLFRESL